MGLDVITSVVIARRREVVARFAGDPAASRLLPTSSDGAWSTPTK